MREKCAISLASGQLVSALYICSDPLANPPIRNILSHSQTGQEVRELVDLCELYPFKDITICKNGHDTN